MPCRSKTKSTSTTTRKIQLLGSSKHEEDLLDILDNFLLTSNADDEDSVDEQFRASAPLVDHHRSSQSDSGIDVSNPRQQSPASAGECTVGN
jgi:hypothetical protein